jgi:hypothetical protein
MSRLFLAAACRVVATAASSRALAQPVALVVNGEAVTDDDIEQRTKFNLLANHKDQSRREIIEELIDDKLKAPAARSRKIDLTDRDVDAQYADMAKRMHITADELTRTLGQGGVDAKTLRAKFLADLGWRYVIRGRFGWGAAGQRAKGQRAKRQRRSGESEERQYASDTTIRHGRFCSRCRPATQPCWRRTRRMRRGCVPVHRL